jgi:hypothetical protein
VDIVTRNAQAILIYIEVSAAFIVLLSRMHDILLRVGILEEVSDCTYCSTEREFVSEGCVLIHDDEIMLSLEESFAGVVDSSSFSLSSQNTGLLLSGKFTAGYELEILLQCVDVMWRIGR